MAPGLSCPRPPARGPRGSRGRSPTLSCWRSSRRDRGVTLEHNPVAAGTAAAKVAPVSSETVPAPALTDGVVTLRAHTVLDADAVVTQCLDPAEPALDHGPPRLHPRLMPSPGSRRNAAAWSEPARRRARGPSSGSTAADAGSLARSTCVRGPRSPVGELGFGLHPDARGHGVMARAVRLVCRYGFDIGGWGRAPSAHPLARDRRQLGVASHRVGLRLHDARHDPREPPGPRGWRHRPRHVDRQRRGRRPLHPATPWYAAPVTEADGIRLRPWRAGDVEAIEPRDGDPAHWMPGRSVLRRETFDTWRHQREERMAEGCAVEWCVADADTDRALGGVVLFSRQGPIGDVAELGYQLFPSARGRGSRRGRHGSRSRTDCAPSSEGGLGLRRLVAETAADNAASNGVLRAAASRSSAVSTPSTGSPTARGATACTGSCSPDADWSRGHGSGSCGSRSGSNPGRPR